MKLENIRPEEIRIGHPLPFDVFTQEGALLLAKGHMVASEGTGLYLTEHALRRSSDEMSPECMFVRMRAISDRLADLLESAHYARECSNWAAAVNGLSRQVSDLSDEDPDASFAAMHLDIHHSYDVVHQITAGLLCARLGREAALPDSQRCSLVAAALTHDLGLHHDRPHLDQQAQLSARDKALIQRHTAKGVDMLEQLGVEDDHWLKLVAEHHERLDGSGILGLKAEQIGLTTRILGLADTFASMLRDRPYRRRILAKDALAQLYLDPNKQHDRGLLQILIKKLGIYPPGSVLRLASREIAISIRSHEEHFQYPEMVALFDPSGRPFYKAVYRDPRAEGNSIDALLPPEAAGRIRKILPACWAASA